MSDPGLDALHQLRNHIEQLQRVQSWEVLEIDEEKATARLSLESTN